MVALAPKKLAASIKKAPDESGAFLIKLYRLKLLSTERYREVELLQGR